MPPEGKTIDDASTLKETKVGKFTATYLDVRGTFRDGMPGSTKSAIEESKHEY